VYAVIVFGKRKRKLVANGLADGTFTADDVFLTGRFTVGVGGAVKGALFTRNVYGRRVIAAVNRERIHISVETTGIMVNSFKKNFVIKREDVTNITVAQGRGLPLRHIMVVIEMTGLTQAKFSLRPLNKGESIDPAAAVLETYPNSVRII
jgi:hypothetical protein